MKNQAKAAYERYAASTGNKTFDGRDMPMWDDLPEHVKRAWTAAVLPLVAGVEQIRRDVINAQKDTISYDADKEIAKINVYLSEGIPVTPHFAAKSVLDTIYDRCKGLLEE